MKKTLVKILAGLAIVPILSVLGYLGYATYLAPLPPAALVGPTPTPEVENGDPTAISAEGKVVPHQHVQLSFSVPGLVEEVFVSQGDSVGAGSVLATLEGHEQQEAVIAAAKLELARAQSDLDALYEHQNLISAQAQLAVVQAQEEVNQAEKQLTSLMHQPTQQQIDAARASVTLAREALDKANAVLATHKDKPKDDAKRAAAQVAVYALEKQYNTAVNNLNALLSDPDSLETARAEANLAVARAQLEEAQRNYEILKNGPDPEDVSLAQVRVESAEAQLAAAQANLADLNLVAPFAGQVIFLDLTAGEVVNPNIPKVVVADLSVWQVKTTNLTEKDVARLAPGMEATIRLNAFPGVEFRGQVTDIDLLGEEQRGSVTYVVTLDFDPGDISLRWEMTAFVSFSAP